MDQIVFQNACLQDLHAISRQILQLFPDDRVFAFYGNLGAGKTTLIKAFCEILAVADEVTSPSFAIVNEYRCETDELVYHFDFYRIKKIEEVLDIGYEEYLFSGWYCFLEWADKVEELLPGSYVFISLLKNESDEGRKILAQRKTTD
ncbi:MAG: tRNA (adenosine(37)-N6)-threonylcarbamoyltransferase complex ATPase subunit type 1 TsaE [Bacteroidales bacterium]|nr:tRNA (adenosine(37)-N6)-threonylcarbamoyltransferase complex ATPase subunit type 1 TsaE [Bacteroidales bacterium]